MKNENVKDVFLNQYAENDEFRYQITKSAIQVIGPFEDEYDKDFMDFNRDEILNVFVKSNKPYKWLANTRLVMSSYIRFLESEDRPELASHAIFGISAQDIRDCIKKQVGVTHYPTYSDIQDLMPRLLNYVDKALVMLMWHGVGSVDKDELLYITQDDVDFLEKTITVGDNHVIPLSDECLTYLKAAFTETSIASYGDASYACRMQGYGELYKSRPSKNNTDTKQQRIDSFYNKLKSIQKKLQLEFSLSATSLRNAGFIHYITKIINEYQISFEEAMRTNEGKQLLRAYFGSDSDKKIIKRVMFAYLPYINR